MDCFITGHPPHPKLFQPHKIYDSSLNSHLIVSKSTLFYKQNDSSSNQHWQLNPCLHKTFSSEKSSSHQHPARSATNDFLLFHTMPRRSDSLYSNLPLHNKLRPATEDLFSAKSLLKIRCNILKSSENGRPQVLTSSSWPLPSPSPSPLSSSSSLPSPTASSSLSSPSPPPSSSSSSPPPPPPSSSSSSSSSSAPSPASSSSSSSATTAKAKVLLASEEQEAALSHLLTSKNLIEFIARVPTWADAQKESGMPQRQQRAFYSHQDWLHHRSSLRHMRHMLSSGSSRVILSLIPPVFTVTAISIAIATYNTAVNLSLLPPIFPLLHAASLPYELTAPAIALLLVFRTDASYSRYDEARKTWTKVMSTTENFVRQSIQKIDHPEDLALRSSLVAYIMAFSVSLKCHLMHGSDERKDLQNLLGDDDLAFVLASHHHPNCLIQLMSQTLCLLQLEFAEKTHLDDNISQLSASISVCERLIRTPIPLSYTRLTSRILVLWHLTLPIILWDSCDWLVVPATFFNAATLFCIEEVGVIIEEPFPMLALDIMIGLSHENIWEMLKLQQITKQHLCKLKRNNKSSFIYKV